MAQNMKGGFCLYKEKFFSRPNSFKMLYFPEKMHHCIILYVRTLLLVNNTFNTVFVI